jgi:hypothetical protein
MASNVDRRGFIKESLTASASLALMSGNSRNALAATSAIQRSNLEMPNGRIRHVEISRLICGGNLIIGSAHDRDLLYIASLMRHCFTDRKIMETWQLCEECGIDPRKGFQFAFENGADFTNVGMFDFQVRENAILARDIVTEIEREGRERPWTA